MACSINYKKMTKANDHSQWKWQNFKVQKKESQKDLELLANNLFIHNIFKYDTNGGGVKNIISV